MADTDLIKKSVTAGDYAETPRGGVINFMLPWYPGAAVGLPPTPPEWWSRSRDYTLRSTVLYEDMWRAAVEIAITKMASLSWEVDSEIPLRARRGQDILHDSEFFPTVAKSVRDFLTADNGQFDEIVRVSKSPVSRTIGLAHLDSLRCTRTGDNEIPVIYTDRKGREHEIRQENIIMLSDMPDPGDTWFGVGLCAASGAYRSIYKLAVIERYVSEKVSGRRPLEINFVSSVSQRQLDGITQSADEGAARQGILSYMGAIVVPILDAGSLPQVATVKLAEMPDRFNRKEEYDIALYSYAANIGLDIQDLQPLTGQPLGTGAQSQVLDEKQKGKGLVYWKKEFPEQLNLKVFDDLTTFAFIEKDYRDQERQAGVSNARATASKTRIDAGITTPKQELQVLVDLDELPDEYLPEDITGETLADDEKPEQEATPEEAAAVEDMATPEEKPAEKPQEAPKAGTKEAHYPLFKPSIQNGETYYQCNTCGVVYKGTLGNAQKEHAQNGLTALQGIIGIQAGKETQAQTTKELIAEMRRANDLLEAALKADSEGDDEGDPGPFKTARQRKWFFSEGPGTESRSGGKPKSRDSKPKKLSPVGTTVSSGLTNETKGKTKTAVNDALTAIDSVHGDGGLQPIPIVQTAGQKTTGQFAYSPYTGEAIEIRISSRSDTPEMDFSHEVGHYIQHSGMHKKSEESLNAARKLNDAVNNSEAYKTLYNMYTDPRGEEIEFEGGYKLKFVPQSNYVRYLLQPGELFARSYSQYIATKSGNSNMLSELRRQQAAAKRAYANQVGDGGGYPVVWNDSDFAPITAAYNEYFNAIGWTE